MKKTGSYALQKASGGLIGIVVLLAALVAANIIAGNLRLRLDLTQERLYTLSDGTRSILGNLEQPVTIKLFFNSSSPSVPVFLKNYARQVTDLLKEYRIAGKGKFVLEQFDPKPDSEEEEWAQRYGITAQQVGMFEPPVYFGLVAVSGNQEAAIPVLDPRTEALLEYNISRLVYRVTHPAKPVVGVMSTLPVLGKSGQQFQMPGQPPQNQPAWLAFRELREDYDLRTVEPDAEELDSDLEALIVVHPKELSDKTLYAIDQFVLRGGRLMLFVDPMSAAEQEATPPQMRFRMPQTSSDLEPLLKTWGVGYDPSKVVVDEGSVTRISMGNGRIEDSPVLLSLGPNSTSKDDVLTSQLETITTPFVGALTDETSDDLTFSPLLSSTEAGVLLNAFSAQFGREALREAAKETGGVRVLAARLSGKFTTAFPDGPPKEETEEGKEAKKEDNPNEEPGFSEGSSTVLIVADTDLLYDRFCVQQMNFFGSMVPTPLNDNLNLFANMVEQMAGGAELSAVRSRGRFSRPFDRVLALEQKARDEWQARENELTKSLQEARRHLSELQGQKAKNQLYILSSEQKQAIAKFRAEEQKIGKELKEVRKNLRRDIERLGMWVKVINIGLMPLIVGLFGIGFAIQRRFK
jgi:ABC-type uncharacterized transport system involved in gliding motility auxiliary subunit